MKHHEIEDHSLPQGISDVYYIQAFDVYSIDQSVDLSLSQISSSALFYESHRGNYLALDVVT
jgi:hypothetical protein